MATEKDKVKSLKHRLSLIDGEIFSLQIGKDTERFFSHYCGVSHDRFLIVEVKEGKSIQGRLMAGNTVTVRFVSDGTVFGFVSKIILYITKPFHLIFLTYPDEIETLELRACERADTFLQAQAHTEEFNLSGAILDLSCSGCLFMATMAEGDRPDAVKDTREVVLSFDIPAIAGKVDMPCRVVSIKREERKLRLGLCFLSDEKTVLDAIADYVDDILRLTG